MVDVKRLKSSDEFSQALMDLEVGSAVRRSSWPTGVAVRKVNGQIVMVRPGLEPAGWTGPTASDSEASDWHKVDENP